MTYSRFSGGINGLSGLPTITPPPSLFLPLSLLVCCGESGGDYIFMRLELIGLLTYPSSFFLLLLLKSLPEGLLTPCGDTHIYGDFITPPLR
jgi:hypothetical protein